MADIFISYTSSDRDWAFWIAGACEALGHAPHVHDWEIGAGEDIYAWMERRHDAADHVLCVLSDAYLKAPYSTLERNAALWQAAEKRPGFVLMVAVAPCRLPTLSDHIRRCELFGVPEEAARQRFRDFMGARSRPEAAAFPGRAVAVSNIPVRVPTHFMGRDDAMSAIAAAPGRGRGRAAVTALHGLRGVGKTTLADLIGDTQRLTVGPMQALGETPTPWPVDGEVGAMEDWPLPGGPLFRHVRYDMRLEPEVREHPGLALAPRDVLRLHGPSSVAELHEIGRTAAERQVRLDHLGGARGRAPA